jgi:hypothetical protein
MQGDHATQVSFSTDIKPLFRAIDIAHMKPFGVELGDYSYMSNPTNANAVLATLSTHNGQPASMAPGGPYWTEAKSPYSFNGSRRGTSRERKV